MSERIELPSFVPAAPPHVDSSSHRVTSILDVWRRYDLHSADRIEASPESVPEAPAPTLTVLHS